MKKNHLLIGLAAIAAGLTACNNEGLDNKHFVSDSAEIRFVTNPFRLDVFSKATVVNASSLQAGFNVSCVKGPAGSDTEVWSSYPFVYDNATGSWKGQNAGKWWPSNDESYRFYAVFPSSYAMSYSAGGPTIQASNAHDIVTAYMASSTFKTVNTLNFEHIFARLNNVTVSAAGGYSLSEIDIRIVPKTGGTYNLFAGAGYADGTGWSELTTGSSTGIANAEPGTRENDIYLVPGTYTLTASWKATKGNYTRTFSDMQVDVSLVGGKINNLVAALAGEATELNLGVDIDNWSDNSINAGTFPVVAGPPQDELAEANALSGEFSINADGGKVRFAKGNLWAHVASGPTEDYIFAADEWGIYPNQWNNDYFEQTIAVGNYVDNFSWTGRSATYDSFGLCTYAEPSQTYYGNAEGDVLKTDWGAIPGVISSIGTGWRTLTQAQWSYILNSRETGFTVGNVNNARFAKARINNNTTPVKGLIIFPDNYQGGTPEGVYWTGVNALGGFSTTATEAGWQALEAAGCVFLPFNLYRYTGDEMGSYWSSTSNDTYDTDCAGILNFYDDTVHPGARTRRHNQCSVRLVRDL